MDDQELEENPDQENVEKDELNDIMGEESAANQEVDAQENDENISSEVVEDTEVTEEQANAGTEEMENVAGEVKEEGKGKIQQELMPVEAGETVEGVSTTVTDTTAEEATKEDKDQQGDEAEDITATHAIDEENWKPKIPVDFYYNADELYSRPTVSSESGLPEGILSLRHSLGYDCRKRDNIHLLDSNTLLYIAGNLLVKLNIQEQKLEYIRSTSGGGIGSVSVHPQKTFFAVAEKGSHPNAIIYEYPSMKVYRILREGTKKAYSHCKFSPDGTLLATVGSEPDFLLTVWDWRNEQIILRTKAFSQDVYYVSWSHDLEGILTTSGSGHIRFWKMAHTFTGLKLQGFIGKFGKTEISDIDGFVELPDGKVLSGCEWGNLLLWDGGLIKVQITRKGKRPCHQAAIQQIIMEEGELMTVGLDGCIRTWDFDAIDTAEASDENALFELEPMNELRVEQDVKLMRIVKTIEPESTIWFAQDAGGHIWRLDLSFSHTSLAPESIISFHSGAITGCCSSPISYLCATTGEDGTVRVYDIATRKVLMEKKFIGSGTRIQWAPLQVDPRGKTIIVGFSDGVIRVLQFGENPESDAARKAKHFSELSLLQALKPHTKAITDIAIDPTGTILASSAMDNTVFFFQITHNYEPIGFVKLQSAVRNLEWLVEDPQNKSIASLNLVAFLITGEVARIHCPDPTKVDHSKTYELQETNATYIYNFHSIKSHLRREEELERKRKELEAQLKVEEEERKLRIERGLLTEEEAAEERLKREKEIESAKLEEEEWVPTYPDTPSPILQGFIEPNDHTKFWLSMGEFDTGYLYRHELKSSKAPNGDGVVNLPDLQAEDPSFSIPVPENPHDVAISHLMFTQSGMTVLCGMRDGSVRVHVLERPFDLTSMKATWQLSMHDNHYGVVTSLSTTFDEKFLISVGADGNFFVYEMMDEQLQQKKMAEYKAKVPSARKPGPLPDDIDDPNAYSIEEHKQKSESDRKLKLAEEKKQGTRRRIADLRKEFKSVKDLNDQLPEPIRIKRNKFEMVPELRKDLLEQRNEKIELTKRELGWDLEKNRIGLQKLKSRFLDYIEHDLVEVRAFASDHKVSTIRCAYLSDAFYALKNSLDTEKTLLERDLTKISAKEFSLTRVEDTGNKEGTWIGDQQMKSKLTGARGERIQRALQKLADKKRERARRKAERDALYATRPADDYEDPQDLLAIKEAKEKMGDFKLKFSKNYVVPDHLRMNTKKAKQKQMLLEEQLHSLRSSFNNRVVKLRNKKLRMIENVQSMLNEVEQLQKELPVEEQVPLPQLPAITDSEVPEKKFEYTRESLLQFKDEMNKRRLAEINGENLTSGFSGPAKKAVAPVPPSTGQVKPPTGLTTAGASYKRITPDRFGTGNAPPDSQSSMQETREVEEDVGPSTFQQELEVVNKIRTLYRRDHLVAQVAKMLRVFDAELMLLRHEKFLLDIHSKKAELRQLTLFQEYLLLKEFEKSESGLVTTLEKKTLEKSEIESKIVEIQFRIDGKKKDIEKLQESERQLHDSFKQSLGENNKFAEYLTKVFKKKIKRKKKSAEGDGFDESEEESDSDDSELDESEEESDEEGNHYDLDMCPPECDQRLYDSTCQLREKRLDIEESMTEEKRLLETYRKELENMQKKQKISDQGLKSAENELEMFQMEKQQKMNELDMVVTLKLSQILVHEHGQLPEDLSSVLVFERRNLYNLRHRIDTLREEGRQQKQQQLDAKMQHTQLIKNKKRFQVKIDELCERCDKEMIDKFGKVDDLERLEEVIVNPKIEELTEKMLLEQSSMLNEEEHIENEIRGAKDQLIQRTKENTKYITQMLMLYNEKKVVEERLDSKQKNLGAEYQTTLPSELEEVQKLMQLVDIQAQELNALKEEIGMLSRKGGHILPPMPSRGPLSGIQ